MKIRRIIAVLLVLVMALSLAACGSKDSGGSASPAPAASDSGSADAGKTYTIGINTWGSGVPVLDMFGDAVEYTLTTLGHKVNRMSDDFTADKELQNAQNMCAAGVDGIVFQAAAVSTVPQIGVECAKAKIPFSFDVFVGEDPDLEKLAESNEFYCGAIDLDMVSDGAAIAQMAFDNGCRKACMIGGNIGDNNMDQRSQGFTEKFTALGGEVLAEARCTDNSECPTKALDMLSAHKDADCVYCFVGDYIEGSLTAIGNLGLKDNIQVYVSCVDEGTAKYIKEGTVMGGNDGISLACYISSTLVLNYLAGHKIVDANGKAPRLSTHPFRVDQNNVDNYMKVFFSDSAAPFTKSMLEELVYTYNPDVSYQDYVDLIANINLDYMLESNGLK
ncbi:MAG: substrate-binding domain-containing protein [Oscillospiraceae bacterium]|nr:substrate-binding domain-containing protein [Oscillospiraceae bacterium]